MSNSAQPGDFLPLTPIYFHILLAVSDEARHGYGIMKEIEEMTEGGFTISAGTMYNSIKRLLRDGLIRVVDEGEIDLGDDADSRRTRYYKITGLGQKTLQAEHRRLKDTIRIAEQKPVLGGLSVIFGGA